MSAQNDGQKLSQLRSSVPCTTPQNCVSNGWLLSYDRQAEPPAGCVNARLLACSATISTYATPASAAPAANVDAGNCRVAETRRTSCGQQGSFIGSRSLEICSSLQEDLQRLDHSGLSSTDDGTVDRVRAHQQQLAPLVTHSSAGGAGAAKNIGIQSHPSVALSPMPSGNHQHKCPLAQRTASLPGEARGFAQLPAQSSLQGPSRTLSHANLLAALSLTDRPPSLADLLGPYFLLLTTPQAADATLQAQALSRALALHHSHVTRRHTLDAPSQNSPCFKHSSSMGSRPSSAPTIPSDWEADLPKGPSCGSPQEGNPLSIISPFQLYQQQRCQQMKAHDKAHEGDEAAHQNHHHQQQQPQNMSPLESEQMPVAAKVKCNRLDHSECVHTAELESKMRKLILHHATAQVGGSRDICKCTH